MDSLKAEAEELAKEFLQGQCFKDISSFVQYTKSLRRMHIEDSCNVCTRENAEKEVVECVEQPIVVPVINTDGSLTKQNTKKSPRKSRRSVCVQKLTYSFSESENDSNSEHDSDSEDEVFINKHGSQESSDEDEDEASSKEKTDSEDDGMASEEDLRAKTILVGATHDSPVVRRKKNVRQILSGSDSEESEEDQEMRKQNAVIQSTTSENDSEDENKIVEKKGVLLKRRSPKAVNAISSTSSENESEDDSDIIEEKEVSLKKHSPEAIPSTSSEKESEDDVKTMAKKSLPSKNIQIESSSDQESDDNFGKFLSNCKKAKSNRFQDNELISSDDTDDFVTPSQNKPTNLVTPFQNKPTNFVTPFHNKSSKFATPMTAFKTPRSSLAFIIDKFPTTEPHTPRYKNHFNKKKDEMIKELYSLYNRTIFDGKLPDDFKITWNKRMTKTAGFCYLASSGQTRSSRIELSTKVVDTVERLRDTLIHELCHAATWIFEGKRGHGLAWKYWAKKANKQHPELPIIATCHSYEIETKYKYQCEGCSNVFGRHTKSIDPTKHACAKCGGRPLLLSASGSVSDTPKRVNAYSEYVKKHFSRVKGENPECSSRDIMKKVAEDFRAFKISEDKENILT